MSTYTPLHDGWTFRAAGQPSRPAVVPGCVHLDLMANGVIPDPYDGDNEGTLSWIGETAWVYETAFDWQDDGRFADLECDGLDTVATIVLNGVEVGRTANMHRRYRFAVRDLLKPGLNTLAVTFDSAYAYARELQEALGDRPNAYPEPFNFIRKMACNFGWDWGPTLVTAGIWRAIGLRQWSQARLSDVRPLATADGTVKVHVEVEGSGGVVTASIAGVSASAPAGEAITLQVRDPLLWFPSGYGEQPLYDLSVTLTGDDGSILDRQSTRIGFRDVELADPFTLLVNGQRVFVRGVNWIPDDCFPSRVTPERLRERFTQALGANVNFLRVWGGGLYESDDFYDLADELGLLVGQDFLFACAAYPEEEPLATEIAAEARDNVSRLARHPSLVWWMGNNENLWGHEDWGWKADLDGKTWGAGYYFKVLPDIVAELDPARPYRPGSPYSAGALHPNDPSSGTMHIWDVWNREDYLHYRSYRPRFVAEYGFQAPPTFSTLSRGEHQKAADGALKLQRALDAHLPPVRNADDYLFYTQVNQARAIAVGVQHFRSLMPWCMGSIVWQLNDCWPVTSWSAIDGSGLLKPMWFALRESYAPRLLTIVEGSSVAVINDSAAAWSAELTVRWFRLDGSILGTALIHFTAPPREVAHIDISPPGLAAAPLQDLRNFPENAAIMEGKPASSPKTHRSWPADLVVVDCGGHRAFWFFKEDKDVAYPRAAFSATVAEVPGGVEVTVTAETILRDLSLFPDRLDPRATVDKALVTLLPGESTTFTVHSGLTLDHGALTSKPVLRCLND